LAAAGGQSSAAHLQASLHAVNAHFGRLTLIKQQVELGQPKFWLIEARSLCLRCSSSNCHADSDALLQATNLHTLPAALHCLHAGYCTIEKGISCRSSCIGVLTDGSQQQIREHQRAAQANHTATAAIVAAGASNASQIHTLIFALQLSAQQEVRRITHS
jgi:hypothetical protein